MINHDTRYRYARLIAWFSWVVVGGSEVLDISRLGPPAPAGAIWVWFAAFAAFGPALYVPNAWAGGRTAPVFQYLRLGLATATPLIMAAADSRSFACALLVIVAWELAITLPMSVVLPWIAVQTAAMTLLLLRAWPAHVVLPEIAIYFAFQGYALLTAHVARSESDARQRLSKAHHELRAAQGILAQNVRVAERLRLARELHDLIGHHLSALVMNLEVARHSGSAQEPHVVKAQELARQLLADVRSIVRLTRSEEYLDLKALVEQMVEDIPQITVHLNIAEDVARTNSEHSRATLRIVQEAATNCMRHSGGANLWICVDRKGFDVRITARDDGVGAERFAWGNGLLGMRERVAELGGMLTVQPNARPGFSITAEWPMTERKV